MKLNFMIVVVLFSSVANASIQLSDALKCDGNPATKTKEQLQAGGEMFKVLYSNGVERISSCLGWTNLGDGDNWYISDKKNRVYSADIKNEKYLGGWNLGAVSPCAVDDEPEDCMTPWWTGRWGSQEFIEAEYIERIQDHGILIPFRSAYNEDELGLYGCFNHNSLRYGDLTGDGKADLAIFLMNDFVIFSPEKKKTIFAVMYNNPDWISWPELIENGLALTNEDNDPQYGSRKLYEELGTTDIGYRGYAKIYVGSFEAENTQDILVWRKFYQSRLKKDPVKGFEKIRDTYIHYKLVNGEYQKQSTASDTGKGWLEAKNLTWQKGYPSKSECPGQVGQLIPEMHDPLLNDPDVLK
ncbi:hypothetical protein FY115_12135 [Cellvibrio japonicus]|nr:hypothetical protein FY117_12135 [Cellvibrio japonicus]QEI17789.1 hypothetical protein FY116_12140 [Cellvibrio japonicus]QEI21364.1 hypothetical protein FY115_12135 [Cellvibrio japonicus]